MDDGDQLQPPRTVALAQAIRDLGQRYLRLSAHLRHASDVNETDFTALTALSVEPGLTAGELAQRLERSPAATSSVLDRLEAAGHLERRRDDADRRRVTLWLTERPERVARSALAPLLALLDAEFADADDEEIAQVAGAVRRVDDVLRAFLAGHAAHGGQRRPADPAS